MEAERLSFDIISTLPKPIIESILCCLPIEEAARTSILSREWRYKWTKIPKLEIKSTPTRAERLGISPIEIGRVCKDRVRKLFCVIHQILLLRQAPIHEFTLSIDVDDRYSELDQILFHLSRNHTVKRLSLDLTYKLPFSVFSFHHLTDLHLTYIEFNHEPTSSGFGSLRTLYLKLVEISSEALLHLLSNCPSLKSASLLLDAADVGGNECPIVELFKCLPAIEHLATWQFLLPRFVLQSVPRELPISLIHLKFFCFEEMCFDHGFGLTFLALLIKCSPHLEKIKLKVDSEHEYCSLQTHSSKSEEYPDVWLEHLNELEIEEFNNSKSEIEFVKFILARSPALKKVRVTSLVEKDQEFGMFTNLLRAPRASPVQIIVERFQMDYYSEDL